MWIKMFSHHWCRGPGLCSSEYVHFQCQGSSAVRLQPAEKPRKFLFAISNTFKKDLNSYTILHHLCCIGTQKQYLNGALAQSGRKKNNLTWDWSRQPKRYPIYIHEYHYDSMKINLPYGFLLKKEAAEKLI